MIQDKLREMARIAASHSPREGMNQTPIEPLKLLKVSTSGENTPVVYQSCFSLILQGTKLAMLDRDFYKYSTGDYLVVPLNMPSTGIVTSATTTAPYLCLRLDLNFALVAELLESAKLKPLAQGKKSKPLFVGHINEKLEDAAFRLMSLLEAPEDAAVLASAYIKEIHYRLLKTPNGRQIARTVIPDDKMNKVVKVLSHLSANFHEQFSVDALASMAGMCQSSFHQRFKQITGVTPLRFQKQLRLIEARRLMAGEGMDATAAAFKVGFESPSHFNREYARMFGAPPGRDINALRDKAFAIAGTRKKNLP